MEQLTTEPAEGSPPQVVLGSPPLSGLAGQRRREARLSQSALTKGARCRPPLEDESQQLRKLAGRSGESSGRPPDPGLVRTGAPPCRDLSRVAFELALFGHPESKSLVPDGTPCKGETCGLLGRYPVTAIEASRGQRPTARSTGQGGG
jgi:hypothetical protein